MDIGDVKLSDAETLNDIISFERLETDGKCLFLSDLVYFKTDTFLKMNRNQGQFFLSYGLYITNLPEQFNFDALYTVYRLRWQIELLFKSWKSILKIHYIRAAKEARVLCQVYGKLIIATLSGIIYWSAQLHFKHNLSFHKVLQYLKTVAIIWAIHIFNGPAEHQNFLKKIIRQINRICRKNNQQNKPTIEFLLENLEIESCLFEPLILKNTA